MRKVVGTWRNRKVAFRFRQWAAATHFRPSRSRISSPRRQPNSPQRERVAAPYLGSVRELMARPCVKRARYTGRWRQVQLSLTPSGLSYAVGEYPVHTKVRTLPLHWIQSVHVEGAARMRFGGAAMAGPGPVQQACWAWSVVLTPAGKQYSSKPLTFGSLTAEAMNCWVEELGKAITAYANAASTNAPPSMLPGHTVANAPQQWRQPQRHHPLRTAHNAPLRGNHPSDLPVHRGPATQRM